MNKQKNKNKAQVFKALLATGIVASPLLTPINAFAATTSILDAPLASVPTADEKAPSKYEFIAQFNPELTKVQPFGGKWENLQIGAAANNSDKYTTIMNPTDAQKGKIGVVYTNVGIYDGRQVDLKITVTDWKSVYANDAGRISFATDSIALTQRGYFDTKMTWQYLDHETQKPVVVDGYMTVKDIDENQIMTLSGDTMKHVDKIYVPTTDTKISYKENSDGSASFYSELNGNNGSNWQFNPYDPDEHRGDFTFLYSGTDHMDITWGTQYTQEQIDKYAAASPTVSDLNDDGRLGAYFSYSAVKPVATEILKPTKLVNDADEKQKETSTLQNLYEGLTYEVTHTIPMETEQFYYESYEMTDTLNDALQLNGDIKIVDETNKDVTDRFDIKVEGQNITAEAKGDFVLSPDFYNHTYKYIVPAKVKADADLTKILKDGVYTVPNSAKTIIDGNESTTNQVTSKLTPTKTAVDKGIVQADKLVDKANIARAVDYKYNVDLKVTNNPAIKSLEIKDDLVDELDAVSAKVLDSTGKDITAEGTLSVDKDKEMVSWTAKNPKVYANKQLKLEITAKVKADADLSKYKQTDGTFMIPNTAEVIEDGTPLKSDTVNVIVPKDPTYTIGDTVWNDADKDGTVDDGEKGIPNASVEVQDKDGKIVSTSKTDENGKYQVPNLPAGEYTITFKSPEGYTPVDQTKVTQTIKLDKDNMDVDLGLFIPPVPKAPTETTIDKSVLEDDGKAVDSRNVEIGKDYLYNVDTVITDSKEITKLVLSDDLEDVLDLKSAKVLNAEGKDITDQGDLAVDEEKEVITWTAKDAKAYAGQTLKLVIDSQVKTDADLKDYTADGKTVIPNTAKVTVDDKSTDSDKVDVIVPMKEEPTTEEPTTEAPTTEEPTTEEPTTEAPTTEEPTTEEPTTEAPTTEEPKTEEPTTEAPTTEPPTTETPVEVITQEQAPTKKPEKVQSKPQTVIQKALPFTGTTEQRWMKSLAYLLVGMGVITGIVFYRKRKMN